MTMQSDDDIPAYARQYPNLISPRFGSRLISASDEFFGAKERLISDTPPIFIPDRYDEHGKWMDGWESRRKRDAGNDWCVIELGVDGRVCGAEIDTRHFTGNYPPEASLEACSGGADLNDPAAWKPLLSRVKLRGDHRHFFASENAEICRFVRLNIFPDGGVARLRLFGEAAPDWNSQPQPVELSALKNGGRILAYNDAHYGNLWALLSEGRGQTMGDGWETRRRREPGNDWIIIALGARGVVEAIEIDTAHFKGNFPESASVDCADLSGKSDTAIETGDIAWKELLSRRKLQADVMHSFDGDKICVQSPITHVRLNIFPDGGVSRFRVFGRREA
ncbi:allantoicase [Hyphococcus sp.]|uniref:allantoicase n=1 Tax=Hyphococcus sp. TaxID=2038636 RepID=UPI00207F0633|nr:MAG: putative allantoicase 1 [Marinicaulis sp.]